jgi:hypothetical protein
MAETTDEFGLVESVGGHFHATHCLHIAVHGEEFIAGDLNLKVWFFAVVGAERLFMEPDGEGLRGVGRGVFELGGVG